MYLCLTNSEKSERPRSSASFIFRLSLEFTYNLFVINNLFREFETMASTNHRHCGKSAANQKISREWPDYLQTQFTQFNDWNSGHSKHLHRHK